jgi:hypothetical protein
MSTGQYTITLDHERGLVHVVAEGDFNKDAGEELITHARKEAGEHHYNIICDVRQATMNVDFSDWFFLPRTLGVYRNAKLRRIKTALVVSAERQERIFRFFETVTANLGMNIRIFFLEEDALEWLRTEGEVRK